MRIPSKSSQIAKLPQAGSFVEQARKKGSSKGRCSEELGQQALVAEAIYELAEKDLTLE